MMEMIWYGSLIGVLVLCSLNLLYSLYITVRNDIREERERKAKRKGEKP